MNHKTRQQAHGAGMMFIIGACLIESATQTWEKASRDQKAAHGDLQPRDLQGSPAESDDAMRERLAAEVLHRMACSLRTHVDHLAETCQHLQKAVELVDGAPVEGSPSEAGQAYLEGRDDAIREIMAQIKALYVDPKFSLVIEHELSGDGPLGLPMRKMDSFNEHSPGMLAGMFKAMAEIQGDAIQEGVTIPNPAKTKKTKH